MKRVSLLGALSVLILMAGCQTHVPVNSGPSLTHASTDKPAVTPTPTPVVSSANPAASAEIIVDDKDAGFTKVGTWTSASEANDYKDETLWAQHDTIDSCTATWTPEIKTAGMYAVYEWHGDDPSNDHATNAPYTITFDGGTKTVTVDMRSNIGKWNLLGTFKFAAGTKGNVTLTNRADGNVLADAVKFVPAK